MMRFEIGTKVRFDNLTERRAILRGAKSHLKAELVKQYERAARESGCCAKLRIRQV